MRHHQPLLSYGASAAAFSATPSFDLPLLDSLVPASAAGTGTPTYSVSGGVGTVMDWEGYLRRTKANEARFTGTRRVENLVTGHSENLANAAWTKNGGGTGNAAAVATGNFATDPLGGSTASRLQLNKGSDAVNGFSRALQSTSAAGVSTILASLWFKSNSGTPTVGIRISDDAGNVTMLNVTLSSSWQRVSTSAATVGAGRTTLYFEIGAFGTVYGATGHTQTSDILVWGTQWENVSGQSNQNPSEYVSVGVLSIPFQGANVDGVKYSRFKNDNTVAAGVVTTVTPSVLITTANGGSTMSCDANGPRGLRFECSQSNNAPASPEDFSAWTTKDNITITANTTATLSPGGDNTADAMVENAATSGHTVQHLGSTGVGSAAYTVQSVFVKPGMRDTVAIHWDEGSGNSAQITFTLTGAGSILVAGLVTGTFVLGTSGIVAYPNGWYRCWQSFTKGTSTTGSWRVIACTPAGAQSYTGTNGAVALYVWGAQVNVAGLTATDPLPGSYSSAGRGLDALTYSFASNTSATAGTAYAETLVEEWGSTAGSRRYIVAFGVDGALPTAPLYIAAADAPTTLRICDGTTSTQKTGGSSMKTAFRKVAASWTGSTQLITIGGTAAQSGTFDGNIGSTAIGLGQPTTYNGIAWGGNIRNVKLYTTAATAAELAGLTT